MGRASRDGAACSAPSHIKVAASVIRVALKGYCAYQVLTTVEIRWLFSIWTDPVAA